MTAYTIPTASGSEERTYLTNADLFYVGQTVRRIADPFRNPYEIVAIIARVVRKGHRLIGGDRVLVIRTWAGKDRIVNLSAVVDIEAPWSEVESGILGRRVSNRADRARQDRSRQAARAERSEYIENLKDRKAAWIAKNGRGLTLDEIRDFAAIARRAA